MVMVHNLALEAYLKTISGRADIPLDVMAYTGENFGITTATVASGALALEDGVRLAHFIFSTIAQESARQPPNHIFTLKGSRANESLHRLTERFGERIEVFKIYAEGPSYEYKLFVDDPILDDFTSFVKTLPDTHCDLLQGNNRFSSHTRKMDHVRESVERFIDQRITLRDPHIPIVSNNNAGYLITAAQVKQAILATVNVPMYSSQTVRLTEELKPDIIVEFGLGRKALGLFIDNGISVPLVAFEGDNQLNPALLDVATALRKTAFRKVVEDMIFTIIGQARREDAHKPTVISVDGISGSGKTTLADILGDRLRELGYSVLTDEEGRIPSLDMFLKDRGWRKNQTAEIIRRHDDYNQHVEFFDWEAVQAFYQQIGAFRTSEALEVWITVDRAYNNRTKTYEARTFHLTRNTIILIEGSYASRDTVADIRYRVVNDRAESQFTDRIERLSPDISEDIEIFFQRALVPSFSRYAREYAVDYFINVSSANPRDWYVVKATEAGRIPTP
jgi:uridine kinase